MRDDKENIFKKLKRSVGDFFYDMSVEFHSLKKEMFGKKEEAVNLKRIKRKADIRKYLFIWLGLALPIANFLIFFVYVNISSIDMAFRHSTRDGYVYDFANFISIFEEFRNPYSLISESLLNTIKYWAFGFFIVMPLCYLISYFFYKKIWGYNFFRYVFFMPSIISAVIMSSFFKFMVEPDGPLTLLIKSITGKQILLLSNSDTAFTTLLLYGLWGGFGINLIYFTANLQRIPIDIIEYSRLDGVNTWQEIRYLLFPLTWPFYSTFMFLNLCGIFGSGGAALLLTQGAYGTYDFPYWQYVKVTDGESGSTYICAALGWLITLIAMPISLLFKHLADKVEAVEF